MTRMSDWQPELYSRFRRYRAEPVLEILGRLDLGPHENIVDLGCGSGENTIELARRTARSRATGIDSSPAMIEAAMRLREALTPELRERIGFKLGSIADFRASGEYSVVFSNAAFHWVKDHRAIFKACFDALVPSGQLVVQMPANEDETSKLSLDRLVREEPWETLLEGLQEPFPRVTSGEDYRRMLETVGFEQVECYYRTFEHPMDSPAEIVEFYRSTALRPFLRKLTPEHHDAFLAAFARELEQAYGTDGPLMFPFRRLFIWARRPAN